MKIRFFILIGLLVHLLNAGPVWAVPETTSFQGRLTDNAGSSLTGIYSMRFFLCDDALGGSCNWTEDQVVEVADGLYNVLLGKVNPIPAFIFATGFNYLEVNIAHGSEWEVLSPRQPFASVPFARLAGDSDTVDGQHAAAFAGAAHLHSGADISSGTVADARIAASIARDSEVMTLVLNSDGAGSGLDADMVDGKQASQFADTVHNHVGEVWAANVAWSNGAFKVTNHANGPSIWGWNGGGGNAIRGYATGSGLGVYGESVDNAGVTGRSTNGNGVEGYGAIFDFYAGGTGTDYGPFTGGHEVRLADDFPVEVTPGMIVAVTGKTETRMGHDGSTCLSSTLPTVSLSSLKNDKAVFGVLVSEGPLPAEHWYRAEEGERFAVVNALGEGRVWVTNLNGDIEAGDYITTSIVPGYGERQNDDLLHSYTLGKAIETVAWDSVSETITIDGLTVKVFLVAVVYTSG